MTKRTILAGAIAALVFPTGAAAQLFKCKGPDGKTVYSDTRCEAAASGSALKVTPNASTLSEREKAQAEARAIEAADAAEAAKARAAGKATDAPPAAATGASAAPAPYELTASDRDHIRNLEVTAGSLGGYSEQKAAARLHISHIRRGAEARMGASDRERRDSLATDLSSTDAKKRSQALSELRSLYNR
jgi:hypothetical protein